MKHTIHREPTATITWATDEREAIKRAICTYPEPFAETTIEWHNHLKDGEQSGTYTKSDLIKLGMYLRKLAAEKQKLAAWIRKTAREVGRKIDALLEEMGIN